MKKDSSKDHKIQYLSSNSVKLPEFVNQEDLQLISLEETNVIRVPFGRRFPKRKGRKKIKILQP